MPSNLRTYALVSAAALACLPCCAGHEERPVLGLSLETEPTTLDPAGAVDYSSGLLSSLVHSTLVRHGPDGEIEPDLAAAWDIAEEGVLYTFRLAEARFSSGRAVSASDVVFSYMRLLDPGRPSPRWWVLEPIEGAAAYHRGDLSRAVMIEALGADTVRIRLERPTSHFLSLLSMPAAGIVDSETVSLLDEDYGRSPCGSGPWALSLWSEGEELTLVRNEYFGGRKPLLEAVSIRIIPEPMTRIAEFEVGNLDILEIPRAELERWRSAGALLLAQEELRVTYIGLNNRRVPFSDARVRRALNHAIDTETILARILFGAGKRARGLIPPPLRRESPPQELYPYDPQRSRELLADAGYPDGFGMEIWQRENPEGARVLESVQAYLAEVGVEATIVTREWSAFKQAIEGGAADAFYLDWFADYPDPENFCTPLFHSSNVGGGGNRAGYRNRAVDSLLEMAGRSGDEARRWDLYREAEAIIYRDAPWIFLWFPTRYEVISPRLKGYHIPLIYNGQRFIEVSV